MLSVFINIDFWPFETLNEHVTRVFVESDPECQLRHVIFVLLHELDSFAANRKDECMSDTLSPLELQVVPLFVVHESIVCFSSCLRVFDNLVEEDGLLIVLALLCDHKSVRA